MSDEIMKGEMLFTRITKLEDIRESNRIKKEICESCMKDLKGIFSDDQLKRFEDSFYKAFAGVVLGRRKEK